MIVDDIREDLFANQDVKYRDFQSKLTPTIEANTAIGVRTPVLRKLAKDFSKRQDVDNFLADLPHKYFDENNV